MYLIPQIDTSNIAPTAPCDAEYPPRKKDRNSESIRKAVRASIEESIGTNGICDQTRYVRMNE